MKKIVAIVFLGSVIAYFVINHYIIMDKMNKASFSCKIAKITYDEKNQPTVYVCNKKYTFPFGREKGDFMVGDSLVKKSGSNIIYQYRSGKFMEEYSW